MTRLALISRPSYFAIKILAIIIKYDKTIKGTQIDNKIIKISLLADDLTKIPTYLKSIENALNLQNSFLWYSNLNINIGKKEVNH